MTGKFDENKGWEILCDQCKEFVLGYVNQEEKPSDENYFGFICGYCSEANNAEQQFTEQ